MSAYSELIKNFEKIRAYMRDFYVFGFKSREEYDKKSLRSYDDERRRVQSWLGDYMRFVRTTEGKTVFLSIDSRHIEHNPLYKAWKTKSFTDGDISLHFILFDILSDPTVSLSLPEILERVDGEYLSQFEEPLMFDESTVRKKLKEYEALGLIESEKNGRKMLYRRAEDVTPRDESGLGDALDFFSEVAPCGVVGSYLLDKEKPRSTCFGFKHHYITSAPDSDVLATLFLAMREKRYVTLKNVGKRALDETADIELLPLRVFISVQSGRQHLIALHKQYGKLRSYRVDYLTNVKPGEPCPHFDEVRLKLDAVQRHIWGVNCNNSRQTEHVEFCIRVGKHEEYIVNRLHREKRCGQVEQIDQNTYRFSADVYDSGELIPWIRTFICRITQLNFSNRTAENKFKDDLKQTYALYGLTGGDEV